MAGISGELMSSIIKHKATWLNSKIAQLNSELDDLQASCDHNGCTKIPKANFGNYDPSCDSYWFDCECSTCGLIWTEDQ